MCDPRSLVRIPPSYCIISPSLDPLHHYHQPGLWWGCHFLWYYAHSKVWCLRSRADSERLDGPNPLSSNSLGTPRLVIHQLMIGQGHQLEQRKTQTHVIFAEPPGWRWRQKHVVCIHSASQLQSRYGICSCMGYAYSRVSVVKWVGRYGKYHCRRPLPSKAPKLRLQVMILFKVKCYRLPKVPSPKNPAYCTMPSLICLWSIPSNYSYIPKHPSCENLASSH